MSETQRSAAPGLPAPAARPSRGRIALLVGLFVLVGLLVAGVRNVSGGEVGVSVNNLTGKVSLVEREGLHFTIPYLWTFYVLDRRTKSLEMLSAPPGGAGFAEDYLNVKASEGDNVKIDVKVQYRIVASKAVEVLRSSGAESLLANGVEGKWVRPMVRAAIVNRFNELSREDMNDGVKRREKADEARKDVNDQLTERFGIEVQTITVENPSSYTSYEVIVRQRKDTDQEVNAIIAQQEQEREAQKKQEKQEESAKKVAIDRAEADAARRLEEAKARATKTVSDAGAYQLQIHSEADGKRSGLLASALGKRAQGDADAAKIRSMAEALSGPNGGALVAAEIAKRLLNISITATPFLFDATIQPFSVDQSGRFGPKEVAPVAPPSAPTPGGIR